MITFPNAKINLGLNITEKRPDGYHNLETVFYPIPLEDALEITILNDSKQKFVLHQSGLEISGEPETNLVVKAYLLLEQEFQLPPVDIYLYKHIPSGAGLGGGSADAATVMQKDHTRVGVGLYLEPAFMLKLLNEKFNLHLADEKLEEYAAILGADCAFFIKNKPTFAEGIGNIFSPVDLSLKGYQLVLVKPDVFVSTRDAFSQIKPHYPDHSLKEIIRRPVSEWKNCMFNDFEKSVFPQYPVIEEIKKELYSKGAIYAAMSGSGSSVFGLFSPEEKITKMDFEAAFCFQTELK